MNKIILAGGCFWCVEAIMLAVKGVSSVKSGYIGGKTKNPTYKEVCAGDTDHAEAVLVEFDSKIIELEQILEIFFGTHDPTQLNKQGNDIGTQYRSAVFVMDDQQEMITKNLIEKLNKNVFDGKIVTTIEDGKSNIFYPAEDYHANYLANNPENPYCQVVVSPKLAKFRLSYQQYLK